MNIPHLLNWRSITVALLISLLLHICMVLYVALEKSGFQLPFLQKQEDLEQLPQEKKYKKDTEWAETKGRSSYGAPVLFRDEPDDEIIPDFTQTAADEPQITAPETKNNNEEDSSTQESKDIIQETKQIEAPIEEKLDIKQETTSFTALQQAQVKQEKNAQIQNKPIPAKRAPTSPQPSRSYTPTATISGKPIAMTKKTPSLAQLTQGVLNYVKDEGQYAVSMIGKKGGVPSDEQMKYERFLQKLGHCLQTSFSINNDKFPQCDSSISSIEIFLALNKDGTLHNLRLVKTSGDPRVDAFMMFAFRDASSSFPTVPHYLPHNPFSITYVIDISPTRNNMGIYRR